MLAGDYAVQALVAPDECAVDDHDATQLLKFEVRTCIYDGAAIPRANNQLPHPG